MKTILVAEDEEFLRDFISSFLAMENYSVLQAENGTEALNLLDKDEVDLIVSDIKMPGGPTGITMYQKIIGSKPPVIFMTGACSDEERDWIKSKHIPLLTKPFRKDELLKEIERMLSP